MQHLLTPDTLILTEKTILEKKTKIERFINNYNTCVLSIEPQSLEEGLPSYFLPEVRSYKHLEETLEEIQDPQKYYFYLTEYILNTDSSYAGIGISDAKGNLFVELCVNGSSTSIIHLTRGSYNKNFDYLIIKNSLVKSLPKKLSFSETRAIINLISDKYGYFEFINGYGHYGEKIYFTDYQDDTSILQIEKIFNLEIPLE
jgi:hypothetical protein